MSYDGKLMAQARARFESDKSKQEAAFRQKREEIYRAVPRLAQIDAALRGTMTQVIAAALRHGQNPAVAVEKLKEENLSLQEERKALLISRGYEPDALTAKPRCATCGDTGYTKEGALCDCLKASM